MIQRQLSIAQMTAVGEQRLHRCDGITSIVLQDLGQRKERRHEASQRRGDLRT